MPLRPRAIAIIGAPLGGWAFFACLTMLGVPVEDAGALAIAWAAFWVAAAWFGTRRTGVSGSMRGGAIVTSLLLPVPVYLLTLVVEGMGVIPATVALPMFAMLFSSAPLYFWTLAISSRRGRRTDGPMLVMHWHQYDSHAPSGAIPPRTSGMRRVV